MGVTAPVSNRFRHHDGADGRVGHVEIVRFMQIIVRDNNVDQALRALKKKLQREGVYREMKLRRHYEKPSEKRARERAAAIRRARKLERKRVERDQAR
jgi:small subunit ribosomal protein S21